MSVRAPITVGPRRATPSAIDGGWRVDVTLAGARPSWAQIARGWIEDRALRALFLEALRAAPCAAYFWETTPVRGRDAAETPFAQVLLESPGLARVRADAAPFQEPLRSAGEDGVATFANLGGDAILVVPSGRGDAGGYAHLATFVRTAPEEQLHALLEHLGRAVLARWGAQPDAPLWVSTSGLGVHWVHVRLDDRPKYYTHRPYRVAPG